MSHFAMSRPTTLSQTASTRPAIAAVMKYALFDDHAERLHAVAGAVLRKPAVQVGVGVVRPNPDSAVEVAHGLIVSSNAQQLHGQRGLGAAV